MQKSTANCCGGITFHPNEGKEEHYNLNGGRPRQAAEFEAFARALESGDQELCGRMQDTDHRGEPCAHGGPPQCGHPLPVRPLKKPFPLEHALTKRAPICLNIYPKPA